MSRINFLLVSLALTGCVKGDPAAGDEPRDRVYTVDEFVAQPALRKQFFTVCSNNPGQLGQSPNCINVRRAEHIASAGTTIPSFAP